MNVTNDPPSSSSSGPTTTTANMTTTTNPQSPNLERQTSLISFLTACSHSDLLFISRTLPSLLNPVPQSQMPSSSSSSPLIPPPPLFVLPNPIQETPHLGASDFLSTLPSELILYILELASNDDPWALVRAESVCKCWRLLVAGEQAIWKRVCRVWGFGSPLSLPDGDGSREGRGDYDRPSSYNASSSMDQYAVGAPPSSSVHALAPGPVRGIVNPSLSAHQLLDEPLEEMEPYAELPMDAALEWIAGRKRRAKAKAAAYEPSPSAPDAMTDSEAVSEVNEDDSSARITSNTTTVTELNNSYRTHFKESCIKLIHWERGGRLMRNHTLPMPFGSQRRHSPAPASFRSSLNVNPDIVSREDDPTYIPSFNPNTDHYHPHRHHHHHHNNHQQHHHQQQQQQQQESGNENSVVTSLALDPDWIVIGLASSRIHVFSARTGVLARTLVGHESGVWGVCLISAGGSSSSELGGKSRRKAKRGAGNDGEEEDADGVGQMFTSRVLKGKSRVEVETDDHPVSTYACTSSSSSSSLSSASLPSSSSSAYSSASSLSPSPPPSRNEDKVNLGPGTSRTSTRNDARATDDDREGVVGEEGLYRSLSSMLRYAVGLGGEHGEPGADPGGKGKGKQPVRGIQSVLDEDEEDHIRTYTTTKDDQSRHRRRRGHQRQRSGDGDGDEGSPRRRYVPQRQSDPCFASRGWGQPNSLVVSGGCDKVVRVWDVKSGHCIYALPGHTSTIRCMRTLHGRPIAVTGSRDGTVRTWDIQRGRPLKVLQGHTGSVRCLDVNGSRAASGSYDTTCRIWDLDTGECLFVLRGHYHQVYAVSFDGELVATGGLDTSVRVWDANTGQCLALLQGHTTLVCELRLSRKHQILVTGGSDGRVITFSLVTYDPDVDDFESYMALPLMSGREGSGESDRRVKNGIVARQDVVKEVFFDRKKIPRIPKPFFARSDVGGVATNQSHLRTVTEVSSAPSSILSSSQQYRPYRDDHRQARVAFEPLYRMVAHTSSISALQFDGRYLVTGGLDGSVHLWETQTGRYVRKMTEDGEKIWKVGFTSASSAWSRRSRRAEDGRDIGSDEDSETEDEGTGDVCVIVGQRGVKTVLEVWKFGA